MRVQLIIESQHLTKEELQLLIQGIRDCEQKSFRDKEIAIWIGAPELSASECEQILASIKSAYKYGPFHVTS